MTLQIIKGNLLDRAEEGAYDYIMHGCNCFHMMGSGIAGEIARRYPEAARVDRENTAYGEPSKLGYYSVTSVFESQRIMKPKQLGWEDKPTYTSVTLDKPFTILNCYTQYRPGPDFIPSIFPYLITELNEGYPGSTIGLPAIGCGIGGSMDNLSIIVDALVTQGPDVSWELVLL